MIENRMRSYLKIDLSTVILPILFIISSSAMCGVPKVLHHSQTRSEIPRWCLSLGYGLPISFESTELSYFNAGGSCIRLGMHRNSKGALDLITEFSYSEFEFNKNQFVENFPWAESEGTIEATNAYLYSFSIGFRRQVVSVQRYTVGFDIMSGVIFGKIGDVRYGGFEGIKHGHNVAGVLMKFAIEGSRTISNSIQVYIRSGIQDEMSELIEEGSSIAHICVFVGTTYKF